MKKLIAAICSAAFAGCMLFAFTACDDGAEEHVHDFGAWEEISAPTCTEKGIDARVCRDCGETEEREGSPATGIHRYIEGICEDCGAVKPLEGAQLSAEGFTKNGTQLYGKVPNHTETYSFIGGIAVAEGATYRVYGDSQYENEITDKVGSLKIGDNEFYILVENGNESERYTITVRRRPMYTVTFDTSGGEEIEARQAEEDGFVQAPIPVRAGYTFLAWDYDFETPLVKDITVSASWRANSYLITFDENGGDAIEETERTVTYDENVVLPAPTRTGYTFRGWYWNETKLADSGAWKVAHNVTAVARWEVNYYRVSVICDSTVGAVEGVNANLYAYHAQVRLKAIPYPAYEFIGWYEGETALSIDSNYEFSVPEHHLAITARFQLKEEMEIFDFSSTQDSCTITGLKDKTITDLRIPDYVTEIGRSAFEACNSLLSLELGSGLQIIGDFAFRDCNNLRGELKIPDSVTSIGIWAFDSCYRLESIVVGKGLTYIEDAAFYGCHMRRVYISDLAAWCKIGFANTSSNPLNGAYLYLNEELVTDLVIPDTVTVIRHHSFVNCRDLKSVTIPNSVNKIEEYAFIYCRALTGELKIPDSVTEIERNAFQYCSNLTSVTIGSGVTYIGNDAFRNCGGLESVTIGSGVTYIGYCAFGNCTELTRVNWNATRCTYAGDNLTLIFKECGKLTTAVIGEDVETIPAYLFKDCAALETVRYEGTQEQWEAIEKGNEWNGAAENVTVVFSDKKETDDETVRMG